MPLTKLEKINNNSYWCIWEITETTEQLQDMLVMTDSGREEIKHISHSVRQRERLASRCCLQQLVHETGKKYKGIVKDGHDKPHLVGLKYHISISHSFPYAVAILHKMLPVGIDIEKPSEKLGRIAHRFLNEEEFAECDGDLKKLCIYWSGKEAIYKLNGKKGLIFKRDIRIAPFELHKRDVIRSEFTLGENTVRVALNYRELFGHIIAYCF